MTTFGSQTIRIALDTMGGDLGHVPVVQAAVQLLQKNSDVHVLLVGDEQRLGEAVSTLDDVSSSRLEIVHASDVVTMSDAPSTAVRGKKDSSMRVAVNQVKNGTADACVSCGNTGALVATSKFVLNTIDGIRRPAILSPIPAVNGVTLMLDLGANATCKAKDLFDFGLMGSVVAEREYSLEAPRVGLLNIGTESGKGSDTLQEASELLTASGLNYAGFVEANQIFDESIDVVVTDGFSGNIALKTMEGFARYLAGRLSRLQNADAQEPVSADQLIDPRTHNGASLVGLKGIVIKSHGAADSTAIYHALESATAEVRADLPGQIAQGILRLANNP